MPSTRNGEPTSKGSERRGGKGRGLLVRGTEGMEGSREGTEREDKGIPPPPNQAEWNKHCCVITRLAILIENVVLSK